MKQLIQLLLFGLALGAWQDGAEIKSHFKQGEIQLLGSFEGHVDDHLTFLGQSKHSLFIGARDGLYNLSRLDLTQQAGINWTVSAEHQEICQIKGQRESECHNFVRVFFGPLSYSHSPKTEISGGGGDAKYLVCGTHAFKPKCRWYSSDFKTFSSEFSGIGYSPFSPSHLSTSVLHHGSVYAATVADFGGTDALIYKQPLRTEQYYDLHLNSPSFVSSVSFGDLALFFFREFAVEHTNCGKAVFSRVARICRHDTGSRKHKDRFTTFLKARLNCSMPGEFPFYFDHIQGTTDILMNRQRREEMLYAVFTTAPNSISASAVCAFSAKDILRAFDGPFKGQSSIDANWLPVPDSEVPKPRPGTCSNDPTYNPDSTSSAFVKGHPLMDDAVQGSPVLTLTSNQDHFTAIAVDHSPEVAPYHILYLGTDSGKVLKAVINATNSGKSVGSLTNFKPDETVITQSWELFPGTKIKTLKLASSRRLFVGTEIGLRIIPVDNCQQFNSCLACVAIRDPHCAWDLNVQQCINTNYQTKNAEILQSVYSGTSNYCPLEEQNNEVAIEPNLNLLKSEVEEDEVKDCCPCTPVTTTSTSQSASAKDSLFAEGVDSGLNVLPQDPIVENVQVHNETFQENEIPRLETGYTQDFKSSYVRSAEEGYVTNQSLVLATTSTAGVSLLIGFVLGFVVSKLISSRQTQKKPATNAQLAATMNESQRLTKPIDFVLNVPSVNNKVPVKNNLNTGTLEKTVKKIYL
ncbi:unnamed protein product [Orchesella dallaii]|uniref:Sema domain-containing protein n=1 Tax=Orchesella dallaii TaxID=48710 RepID=A0ABP1QWW0_9HEXA